MGRTDDRSLKKAWHAVSVVPGGKACEYAMALREKRFLAREAPRLPLPNCPTSSSCACVYRHHADRRVGPRRSSDETGIRSMRPQVEQRLGRGRRKTD